NTGACDPFDAIAAITKRRQAWLHVDGAFGLWAGAAPAQRALVAGVARADSWATDAHKWLNVPYDSGLAIVADSAAHRAAFTANAAYLEKAQDQRRDPEDWTPEFSRRARGFPIYAALRSLGRAGVAAMIERSCALARRMADRLAAAPGVSVLNDVVLNQVLVRFSPPGGGDADACTRQVVEGVQREGTCWLGGTTWQGRAAMRISVSGWSTTPADADRSVDAILRVARG
ncbi:MAG TPA: pyridoxal-dependent decarboxylase, partial [Gemmatimonadales bacterium]